MKACRCIPEKHHGFPVQRKAINAQGQLGSFYDSRQSIFTLVQSFPSQKTKPIHQVLCQIFDGKSQRTLSSYMTLLGFNNEDIQHFSQPQCILSGVTKSIRSQHTMNESVRLLHYVYRHQQTKLKVKTDKFQQKYPPPQDTNNATHIVTKIISGIEFLFIFEITSRQAINDIDQILRKLRDSLLNIDGPWSFSDEDRHQLALFTRITIYGNEKCLSTREWSLFEVLEQLSRWRETEDLHQAIEYIFQPVNLLYPTMKNARTTLNENGDLPKTKQTNDIDTYLKRTENDLEQIGGLVAQLKKTSSSQWVSTHFDQLQQQYMFLLDRQQNFKEDCDRVRKDIQHKRSSSSAIIELLTDEQYECLKVEQIGVYRTQLEDFIGKTNLIKELEHENIHYINIVDILPRLKNENVPMEQIDNELKEKYHQVDIFWLSSDKLRRTKAIVFKEIHDRLLNEKLKNNEVELLYVDFSQCFEELDDFKLIIQRKVGENEPSEAGTIYALETTGEQVNVLIVGESGVGKSTFINALINYAAFATLDDAIKSKPIAIIPGNFLLATGADFQEKMIKFGDIDPNEDYQNTGQSVTQTCRSYLIPMTQNKYLRLIDTPGMGDTRGVEQDDRNMKNILEFISRLTHLNAICILFKPNESRLNIVMRSYFEHLLGFLGEKAGRNVLFCFTNTRSTFYTPGNTGPLIRSMIQTHDMKNVNFDREHVYCFDSESFRYLLASQQGIDFDGDEKSEYGNSWKKSVEESRRLLKYIFHSMESLPQDEWRSVEHLEYTLSQWAHPIFETICTDFRKILTAETVNARRKVLQEIEELERIMIKIAPQLHLLGIQNSFHVNFDESIRRKLAGEQSQYSQLEKHLMMKLADFKAKYDNAAGQNVEFEMEQNLIEVYDSLNNIRKLEAFGKNEKKTASDEHVLPDYEKKLNVTLDQVNWT